MCCLSQPGNGKKKPKTNMRHFASEMKSGQKENIFALQELESVLAKLISGCFSDGVKRFRAHRLG